MPDAQERLDPNVIREGQRFAWCDLSHKWHVTTALEELDSNQHRRPLIEPEQLPDVPVGAVVLNVASGVEWEWTAHDHAELVTSMEGQPEEFRWFPLLALVSIPEEDTDVEAS